MNLTSNKGFREHIGSRCNFVNVVKSARIMSLTKTKKWLHWLIDTGRVYLIESDYDITTNEDKLQLKNVVDIMVDCMNRRYGDNWDVHIEEVRPLTFEIEFFTIFAETQISNEVGLTHTIKDLIIAFPIKFYRGNFYTGKIQGSRLTMSRKEYDSDYCHSHLPSKLAESLKNTPFDTSTFCIGNGDLSSLGIALIIKFNARLFEALLYELDATVRWESLSGTPYVYLKNLSSSKRTKVFLKTGYEDEFISYILNNPLDLSFYISGGRYKIKLDHVYESFVQNLIVTNEDFKDIKDTVLCTYHAPTKSYFKANSVVTDQSPINITHYNGEKAYLIYNGEKRYFSITKNPTVTEETTQEIPIIHPIFLKNVHSKLESLLHEKVTRCSAISKYHSTQYQSINITQDTVLV